MTWNSVKTVENLGKASFELILKNLQDPKILQTPTETPKTRKGRKL